MYRILSLSLFFISITYPQFSDKLKTFEYENSFIKASFNYSSDFKALSIGDYQDKGVVYFATLCYNSGDHQLIDSIYLPPQKLSFIDVFISTNDFLNSEDNWQFILSDNKWVDRDTYEQNKEKCHTDTIIFNGWNGFSTSTQYSYKATEKNLVSIVGFRYLITKKINDLNYYIIGDERNCTGTLEVMKMVCETITYLEKSLDKYPERKYKNIKEVDFYNFEYPDAVVKDSIFYEDFGSVDYYYYCEYRILKVTYGDLTGDGKEEAAIMTYDHTTGTTGQFTGGYVYTLKDDLPIVLYEIEYGDRAAEGVENIEIKGNILEVTRLTGLGGMNWPDYSYSTQFKWNDSTFIPINCQMHTLSKPSSKNILDFNSSNKEIAFSVTTSDDIYYSIKLIKETKVSIEVSNDNTKYLSCAVLTDSNGLVLRDCDDYCLQKFELSVAETGIYFLRIILQSNWEEDLVHVKIKQLN